MNPDAINTPEQQTLKSRATSYKKNSANKFGNSGFSEKYDPLFDKSNTVVATQYKAFIPIQFDDPTPPAINHLYYDIRGLYGFFFNSFNLPVNTQTYDFTVTLAEINFNDGEADLIAIGDWQLPGELPVVESFVDTGSWGTERFEFIRGTSRATAVRISFKNEISPAEYTLVGVASGV